MKNILMTALLLTSVTTWANQESMTCITEKDSKMLIVYESYPASIISLSINGTDFTNKVLNFGTSGGSPVFRIDNFPQDGMSSGFKLDTMDAGYDVRKNGSFSSTAHTLKCEYTTVKKAVEDKTSF